MVIKCHELLGSLRLLVAGEIREDYLKEIMVDLDCERYTRKSVFQEEGIV